MAAISASYRDSEFVEMLAQGHRILSRETERLAEFAYRPTFTCSPHGANPFDEFSFFCTVQEDS
jgi:hypothetical protein